MNNTPWTADEVERLERRQADPHRHPYTCGQRDGHPIRGRDRGVLVATANGWECPDCDYRQTWAHEADLGRQPVPQEGEDTPRNTVGAGPITPDNPPANENQFAPPTAKAYRQKRRNQ